MQNFFWRFSTKAFEKFKNRSTEIFSWKYVFQNSYMNIFFLHVSWQNFFPSGSFCRWPSCSGTLFLEYSILFSLRLQFFHSHEFFLGQLFLTYASTSITYWVPLIVITILYIHIYKVAKNLKKKKMLRTANPAPAHRPPAIDKSRKRSPSSPNVITAHGGMLEFVHIERGMKTREGSIESNNYGFPG